MAKIILRQGRKDVLLSVAEHILLTLGELGVGLVGAFFPRGYPGTRPARRILGLDRVKPATIHQELWRLRARKLITRTGERGGYTLTDRGRETLRRISTKVGQMSRWDGAWHVVIFDIPEQRKRVRDLLRYELSALGFQKLQASVWVHRYPVSEEFYRFLDVRGLVPNVITLKVSDASQIERIEHLCASRDAP